MPEEKPERPLPPGSTIGILGGGQLGRMLADAASRLGFRSHVYCPEARSPAFQVTDRHTQAAYTDWPALEKFARSVDVVTYEFENVPAASVAMLAKLAPVAPEPSVLELAQDRFHEKSFIRNLGLPVADFSQVSSRLELEREVRRLGCPCVLKTRRMGYDGKGQFVIREESDLAEGWQTTGGAPALLESWVGFSAELSVIVARAADHTLRIFDIAQNRHRNHILHSSTVPADIGLATAEAARRIGTTIAEALDYVGVLAVELFLVRAGGEESLLVNEIAPRVHNSGHWTLDACQHSQFELHVRAIAGWPLPEPARHSDVEMVNLLGDDVLLWRDFAGQPGVSLHLYGKDEIRPGRKMGHVNRLKSK